MLDLTKNSVSLVLDKVNNEKLTLDLSAIYQAESRLMEVSSANDATATELMAFFNNAANTAVKYLAWLDYEILVTTRALENAKATVILDKIPEFLQSQKESKIKSNEDLRQALITRDPDCQRIQQILDQLTATKQLLEGKFWTFIRAFKAARIVAERKNLAPTPNLTHILT